MDRFLRTGERRVRYPGCFDCHDGNTKMGTFSWDDLRKSGAIHTRHFTPASQNYAGINSGGNATGTASARSP